METTVISFDGDKVAPVLDYLALTDPCYVIDDKDNVWDEICTQLQKVESDAKNEGNRFPPIIIQVTDDEGGEMWLLFTSTNGGDGSYDWMIDGHDVEINTENRSGELGVDAGLIGIASYNQKAIDNGWACKPAWCSKTLRAPGMADSEPVKEVAFDGNENGNMTFAFDSSLISSKDWEPLEEEEDDDEEESDESDDEDDEDQDS